MSEEREVPSSEAKQDNEEEDANAVKDESELKYNYCKYCKGILPKSMRRGTGTHCSKICSETNKMVPSECFFPETGKLELKASFLLEKDWSYYREVIKDKAASLSSFCQTTVPVYGLEVGMKVECLDISNPVNYCVATIINIFCHRICLRYDGFGQDSSRDFWCNFQAEELFPIGWCAQNHFHLQPPAGITCSYNEWQAFLSRTLTGALAAPIDLFKKPGSRRQLRCHSYLPGDKVEVIHPDHPDLIVPAIVTKSLGPYYYLVTTDAILNVPSKVFYGYADCPNVYPHGWCESRGLELVIPSAINDLTEARMVRKPENLIEVTNHGVSKRHRMNSFKIANKLEALDGDDTVRVATVAEAFGRVSLLVFDDTHKKKFIDKNALDVFPIGWSEFTKGCLNTPYGAVDFRNKSPTIGPKAKEGFSKASNVQSASFKKFQELSVTSKTPNSKSASFTSASSTDEKPTSSTHVVDGEPSLDVDLDVPESPASPSCHNIDIKKSDLDQFVIWLLNKYETDLEDKCSVVKSDLVDSFTAHTNRVLSPRWFTSIYKLFPDVTSSRKSVNDRFVITSNCLKFLREKQAEKSNGAIYVKDAVEFVNTKGFAVQLGSDRLVAFFKISHNAKITEDTQEIFNRGKAPEGSDIFVISADINTSDFTLNNFEFHLGLKSCQAPIPKISNMNEFRACMILCKQANLCTGVEYTQGDKISSNRIYRNGRKYSIGCNIVAYPHRGFLCPHCKVIRGKANSSASSQHQQQNSENLNDVLDESQNDDVLAPDDAGNLKDDDEIPGLELKIYFNKSCYPGLYLNPDKVAQIAPHTPQEKPAQALKYLIDRLIEVSANKEKFLEIIEISFGTKMFNKSKDKIVKKGLFRFNTRIKVLRFMKRLIKRLNCCESFLSLDQTSCQYGCKGNEVFNRKKKENSAKYDEASNPLFGNSHMGSPSMLVQANKSGKLKSGQMINTPKGNVQVLYQLPPSMVASTTSPASNNQHIVVQNSDGKNLNFQQQRFPQGTQFFLPQTSGNVTYMVVSNKDKIPITVQNSSSITTNVHSPIPAPIHSLNTPLSSPPAAGVSQILANVSKTNLVTDIDNPNSRAAGNTRTIWVKKENTVSSRYDQQQDERKHAYHENTKYPHMHSQEAQRSQFDPMRPVVQTGEKGHQIHVHKVHHGNARVKYVEFKPVQDGGSPNASHGYTQYYPNPSLNAQHISIQTQGQSPKSPLHSPPALRPPPSFPPRSVALHSPPSLVHSPDVRPRFDYQTNVRSPVQVTNLVHGKHKSISQTINLPRLPTISNQPNSPGGMGQMGKSTVIQAFRPPVPGDGKAYQPSNSSGPTTTMTVTMTYIPIQTSSNNKLVYVPVNSLQTNQGQPVVLYPHNQTLKDRSGKPVILSPQVFQNNKNVVVVSKGETSGAFTTVRIQGNSQNASSMRSPVAGDTSTTNSMKGFKYQFGNNITPNVNPYRGVNNEYGKSEQSIMDPKQIKMEESERNGEIMTLINNSAQSGDVLSIASQSSTPMMGPGNKRKLSISHEEERRFSISENGSSDQIKQKKRRGRPPSSSKLHNSAHKHHRGTPIAPPPGPITLANRVLSESFFKRQQQSQNHMNYLEEPLRKCPDLPENPEHWSPDDVYKFLLATECAQYADALKEEEMDGKSFLLLTRDALMEFKGFRLGPALKIVGYSSYLRAKNRVLLMKTKEDRYLPQETTPAKTVHKERRNVYNSDVAMVTVNEAVQLKELGSENLDPKDVQIKSEDNAGARRNEISNEKKDDSIDADMALDTNKEVDQSTEGMKLQSDENNKFSQEVES